MAELIAIGLYVSLLILPIGVGSLMRAKHERAKTKKLLLQVWRFRNRA